MPSLKSQAKFNNYSPASIGWGGANDPMQHSGLLAPFVYNGVSFGSMHRDVHGLFTVFLDRLVPLIGGTPNPVKGQCGCYNPGSVTVGGTRSFHTYAIAIDINWGFNPMYAKSRPTGPHALPRATSKIANDLGLEWGGDWTYPQDWMHVEVHLPPAVARTVQPSKEFSMTPAEEAKIKAMIDARADQTDAKIADVRARQQAFALVEIWGDKTHPDSMHAMNAKLTKMQSDLATLLAAVKK